MIYTVTGIWKRPVMNEKFAYYLQVEQKLRATNRIEKVWIHPFSIPKDLDTSTVNVGDEVEITDKLFEYGNIHAIACRCSKCSGLFKDIIDTATKKETIVINTHGKTADEVADKVIKLAK